MVACFLKIKISNFETKYFWREGGKKLLSVRKLMNNQIYIWGEKNRVNSNAFCRNKRVDNTFFVDLIILVGRVILLMPLLHYLEELFFVG